MLFPNEAGQGNKFLVAQNSTVMAVFAESPKVTALIC